MPKDRNRILNDDDHNQHPHNHGSLWIKGYHGHDFLDLDHSQKLIAKIAGLNALGVNLNHNHIPIIQSHIDDVYKIIGTGGISKKTIQLTNYCTHPPSISSSIKICSNAIQFKSYDFIKDLGSFRTYFKKYKAHAFDIPHLAIKQFVAAKTLASFGPPYNIAVKILIKDLSTDIMGYQIIKATFGSDLDLLNETKRSSYVRFKFDTESSGLFLLGRYTIKITQLPLFQFHLISNTSYTLNLLTPLEISIDSDHMYNFFTHQHHGHDGHDHHDHYHHHHNHEFED